MKSSHLRHLSLLLLVLLLMLVNNPVQATSYDENYAWILFDILDNEGEVYINDDFTDFTFTSSYE